LEVLEDLEGVETAPVLPVEAVFAAVGWCGEGGPGLGGVALGLVRGFDAGAVEGGGGGRGGGGGLGGGGTTSALGLCGGGVLVVDGRRLWDGVVAEVLHRVIDLGSEGDFAGLVGLADAEREGHAGVGRTNAGAVVAGHSPGERELVLHLLAFEF